MQRNALIVCVQALLKPHAKISKYMAYQLREEFLDDVLSYIAQKKSEGIAELTRQTFMITTKRLEQLVAAEAELLASAEGQGLDPLQPYVLQTVDAVATDNAMLYVKALMQVASLTGVNSTGPSLMALLPEAAARELLTTARDKEVLAHVEKSVSTLQGKLGIHASAPWRPGQPEYQVCGQYWEGWVWVRRCAVNKHMALCRIIAGVPAAAVAC